MLRKNELVNRVKQILFSLNYELTYSKEINLQNHAEKIVSEILKMIQAEQQERKGSI